MKRVFFIPFATTLTLVTCGTLAVAGTEHDLQNKVRHVPRPRWHGEDSHGTETWHQAFPIGGDPKTVRRRVEAGNCSGEKQDAGIREVTH